MPAFDQTLLRTERLTLRPLHASDAPALFAIFSDRRVARYLSGPAWPDIGTAHEHIARHATAMADGHYVCLGIERTRDGALLGDCTLFNWVPQCRRAELGYALGFDAWGQGYMGEALTALLAFGFAELALNRVEADIDPRNLASAKSLERLGFPQEGLLRERWIVEGEVSDSGLYGLLACEWAAKSGAPGALGR